MQSKQRTETRLVVVPGIAAVVEPLVSSCVGPQILVTDLGVVFLFHPSALMCLS